MKEGSSGMRTSCQVRTREGRPRDVGAASCCAVGAARLAGLAVLAVAAAVGAELVQRQPVGVVATVLLGDVVAVLALLAGHGDLRTDIGGGHGSAFLKELGTGNRVAETSTSSQRLRGT